LKVELVRKSGEVGVDFSLHIFASPGYLSCCSADFGWLVSADFALPFYVDRILFFRRLIFTSAPLAKRADADLGVENGKIFLDAAVALVKALRLCDFITKPQSNAVFEVAPQESVSCPWGTFETRIDLADEELLKTFHAKHRNVINKAIRDGVTVRLIEQLETVHNNIRNTLLRQKLPYYPSLAFIQSLHQRLPGQLLMMGAFCGEQLQGVALVPFDKQRGYYLYGGSIENPAGGALNLLQYEIMRKLRDDGVIHYDFVGARIDVEGWKQIRGNSAF